MSLSIKRDDTYCEFGSGLVERLLLGPPSSYEQDTFRESQTASFPLLKLLGRGQISMMRYCVVSGGLESDQKAALERTNYRLDVGY